MLGSLIIGVFSTILGVLIGLFPNSSTLPEGIDNAFNTWSNYLHQGQAVFPIAELLQGLSVVVLVEGVLWTIIGLLFIFRKIRGA